MRIDGSKLNYHRERKLMTVRELAKACGMSSATWWRASNGENVRVTSVRRLCEVLGIKVEDIELKEEENDR